MAVRQPRRRSERSAFSHFQAIADTPYASQYVSLFGVVLQNIVVFVVAGPELFARFNVALAIPLLGIGFVSRGLDVLFASEASSTRELLLTKTVAGAIAGAWCIVANALLLTGEGTTALALVTYVIGLTSLTIVDTTIVRARHWLLLFSFRATLALTSTMTIGIVLATSRSAESALALAGISIGALAAATGAVRWKRGLGPSERPTRVAHRHTDRRRTLLLLGSSIALVAPNNLLSNGFLLIGDSVLDSAVDVAVLRILLLGAGTVVAAFPLSQAQITAMATGNLHGPQTSSTTRIFALPLAVAFIGAAIGQPLAQLLFRDVELPHVEVASVLLSTSLVLLGWYGVATRVALEPSERWTPTYVSGASALAGAVISALAFSLLGTGGLSVGLLAMGTAATYGSRAHLLVTRPISLIVAVASTASCVLTFS